METGQLCHPSSWQEWWHRLASNSTSRHPDHQEEGEGGPPASVGESLISAEFLQANYLLTGTQRAHIQYIPNAHIRTWGRGRISIACETYLGSVWLSAKTSRRLVVNKYSSLCQRGRPSGTNQRTSPLAATATATAYRSLTHHQQATALLEVKPAFNLQELYSEQNRTPADWWFMIYFTGSCMFMMVMCTATGPPCLPSSTNIRSEVTPAQHFYLRQHIF